MARGLSLEQRTERLVQRSQALLRPRPCGPERAEPVLGSTPCSSALNDPLVQWRLRRCRGEEPALDTPLAGGALQGAGPRGSRDPAEAPRPIGSRLCGHRGAWPSPAISQEPLRREPCWESRDPAEAPRPIRSHLCGHQGAWPSPAVSQEPLRREPFWESRDCGGALWRAPYWKAGGSEDALRPAREALPEPLHRAGPGSRPRDPREAPQPIRSGACDAHQGEPWEQPLGPAGDPLLRMLRCHRRALRGRLRAVESLLQCPPGQPRPAVGPLKQ
ncbi:uncharacterized protein LOC135288520 isoform X2 [Passer domesticus]|uniref:uncharacterized protein LOC135288520 isoform X2 n=1 Tax=Passer domesticus TaxID=48849 RepID=UPI0030FE08BA